MLRLESFFCCFRTSVDCFDLFHLWAQISLAMNWVALIKHFCSLILTNWSCFSLLRVFCLCSHAYLSSSKWRHCKVFMLSFCFVLVVINFFFNFLFWNFFTFFRKDKWLLFWLFFGELLSSEAFRFFFFLLLRNDFGVLRIFNKQLCMLKFILILLFKFLDLLIDE